MRVGAASCQSLGVSLYAADASLHQRNAFERTGPEARQERQNSRAAYHGQSPAEALSTARSHHRAFVDEPFWPRPRLQPGERIGRYLGDFSAVVDRPHETGLLLESTAPLRARTVSGSDQPIDTTLVHQGSDLVPANAPVAAKIAKDPRGGIRLADSGIGITVPGG